ncbi:MAG: AAA family ATPase [Opitutales bacterium]|nr:AAA family ATPase [Opitutales bacterium]
MIGVRKTVIINRAVPGSGKSTICKALMEFLRANGAACRSHSTDDFFMEGDRYVFDLAKLKSAHQKNAKNFEASLKEGIDVVFCDNVNLEPWETKPYTDMAAAYGYKIVFLNFAPREIEKHIASQKVTSEKPDAHQVPAEKIKEFIEGFYIYNPLLGAGAKIDPQKHRRYEWDETLLKKVDVGCLEENFRFDRVVNISPDEYHKYKKDIKLLAALMFD